MKSKIIKTMILSIMFIIVLIIGVYFYVIQGEKLSESESIWITDIPIAHRGFDNGDIPENSMAAFKAAIEKSYAIELDVMLTKDKELIIFHDNNLERLTGDKRNVGEVDYAEIKELKLENTEERIPTLKEVIELVNDQVPLVVEIKNGKNAKELAEKTYELMKDYKGRYLVQSFDPYILEWFKINAPDVIRCQLSCNFDGEQNANLKWYEKFVLKNLLFNFKSKPHIIGYDLETIDNLSVKLLKGKYPILTWTIKNEEDMKLGYEKADNIIFDNVIP